ncbi:MAG: T9SS type A sorting domain-containing protein [Microscillaceae bacterium]|nr:T9SS type A sorting domain-containing protein [Microscillaceae bacterium]MDW8460051.1 FlgD immunoglobulin-like domain containing protein [Cytophagales bacterium]
MKKTFPIFLLVAISVWAIYPWFFHTQTLLEIDNPLQPQSKRFEEARFDVKRIKRAIKQAKNQRENPNDREEYFRLRRQNPFTGQIPPGIEVRSLAFSQRIPTRKQVAFLYSTESTEEVQELTWQFRGPSNVGGRTRALGIDVANENIILAGGVSGGMWRSTNGGKTWQKVTANNQLQSVSCLVQDTRVGKTNIWYYGTGELTGNSAAGSGGMLYRGNGIYKSTNNGQTWQLLTSTAANNPQSFVNMFQWVWRVAVNTANTLQDEVYAATFGGIQRSINGGATWTTVLGNLNNNQARFTDVAVSPQGIVYATLSKTTIPNQTGTVSGFFRSTNGIIFTNITPPDLPERYDRTVIAIAPSNPNIVYFFVTIGNGAGDDVENRLYRYTYLSGDGSGAGGKWERLRVPTFGGNVGNMDTQGSYNMVLAVKPDNPDFVLVGGTNLYRSTDGFRTVENISWIGGYDSQKNDFSITPNHYCDQHALVFYPSNPNRLLSSHDGGISRTENITEEKVTWQSLNNDYRTAQFYTLALDPEFDAVAGGMQDNGTYVSYARQTNPKIWEKEFGGDGSYCAITRNSLIVSSQKGRIYRFAYSTAGRYLGFTRLDPEEGRGYSFINPFEINPNNQFQMYLPAADTLWYNSNISQIKMFSNDKTRTNWRIIALLPSLGNAPKQRITAIRISRTPANIGYIGTSRGKIYRFVHNPNENRVQLVDVSSSLFPANAFVSCIAINPSDANKVMISFSNYEVQSVFYTENGGNTWANVSGNLEENPNGTGAGPAVDWVEILPLPNQQALYFAGTTTGLYSTMQLDGIHTIWAKEGQETIGNTPVDMIRSRFSDGTVAVATHGNGVFMAKVDAPLNVFSFEPNPTAVQLFQNFPNPFDQATTIRYELPEPKKVLLQIIDTQGKTVATLVNTTQPAGKHEFVWQGETESGGRVQAGIYFCRLVIDKKSYTRKMMFLNYR